jgi:DNA-binding HxlR family transcriptional regulator
MDRLAARSPTQWLRIPVQLVVSLRLRALEEYGIVERRTYPEVPPRVEYGLTEKGRALVPLIEDMRVYGRRWLLNGDRRHETVVAA